MARDNINDILVFIAVARERSFTRAAAKLGMSQSALSHIVRGLEERLGVRLLTRTTRSVSPTEAGERLLQNVGPRLEEIDAEITAISDLGDKPSGTVRITAIDHVIDTVLWPRIAPLLPQYPEIRFDLFVYPAGEMPADAALKAGETSLVTVRSLRGSGAMSISEYQSATSSAGTRPGRMIRLP